MQSVQETFNVVIEKGYLDRALFGWMCGALWNAHVNGVISLPEEVAAETAIKEYLKDHVTLRGALENSHLSSDIDSRKAIYLDWANRPELVYKM